MKKPGKNATASQLSAYRAWVRAQLADWDPADDRGGPDVYVPRNDGIKAADVENASQRPED